MLSLLFACTPDLTVTDRGAAGLLGHRLGVDGARSGAIWAECTSGADPGEDHLAEATGDELDVFGLLADTPYDCEVHDGHAVGALSFRTDPLPVLPALTATGETSGYTLVNTQDGVRSDDEHHAYVVVVDPDGGVRWLYDLGTDLICDIDAQLIVRPTPSAQYLGDGFHLGGGWASFSQAQSNRGVFLDVDLAGKILLERDAPDEGQGFNHHCERLADGTTLSLTGALNNLGDHTWVGVGVEQWSPADGVVWSWSSQQLVDEGVLPEPNPDTHAPYTANAVALVEDPWGPGAWVSSYSKKELWRIDRATGERTHVIPDEFTVWDAAGNELDPSHFTYDQHDPEWVDGPLGPDTRVLMYDNGNYRPGGSYSRVVEYDVDLDARKLIERWDWTEDNWWNPTLGDADRLPDGHVLIAKGFNLSKSPNSTDVAALVELDPPTGPTDPGQVTWRLAWDDQDWNLYRAQRIDACSVFANGRYCADVAHRLRVLGER